MVQGADVLGEDTRADGSRHVLPARARELYLRILDGGAVPDSSHQAGEDHESLRQLLRLGLVVVDPEDPRRFLAVDPQRVEAHWGMLLHAEAMRLMDYAAALPEQLRGLSAGFRAERRSGKGAAGSVYVQGGPAIRERLHRLRSSCSSEVVTVQPGRRVASAGPEGSLLGEAELLGRGVRWRSLYQGTARHDPDTRAFARWFTEAGGEVRTLDEPLRRLFVFDARTAVLPLDDGLTVAAFTDDPTSVRHILGCFERDWRRAEQFAGSAPAARDGLTTTQAAVVRLLSEGLGQQVIAERLGLSRRTVAGHIARVREHYGADNLFQLALLIGREEGRSGGERG
jgi:DNA-binding CsgD family transcriptional regulator